jgi:tetratricopeptide (TPR) repeat protein
LTIDARLAECLLLQGESAGTLSLATDLLQQARRLDGVSVETAMLHRLRGWAFMQMGRLGEAHAELEEALRLANARGENFAMKSPHYEAALSLDGLAQLQRLTGEPADEFEHERDTLLEQLSVIAIPEPPLARTAVAS